MRRAVVALALCLGAALQCAPLRAASAVATPAAADAEAATTGVRVKTPRALLYALTPACEVAPGFRTDCWSAGSCDCARQCEALHGMVGGFAGHACFNHTRSGDSGSDTLEALLASRLLRTGRTHTLPPGGTDVPQGAGGNWQPVVLSAERMVVHPRECAGSCSMHGWCQATVPVKVCSCFQGWRGERCEEADRPQACINGCTGRGECVAGVCACEHGRHGVDCSMPLPRHAPPPRRPRIYVYELPPAFNVWRPTVAIDRNTAYLLWERLLASPHRTTHAADADYFFVPVAAMGPVDHGVPMLAAQHVAATWPFWNASGGADHIFVWSWDFGPCWVAGYEWMRRAIHVSHYGLTRTQRSRQCACAACGPAFTPGKDVVVPSTLEFSTNRPSPAAIPPPPLLQTGRSCSSSRGGPQARSAGRC
jgi:hypothetical protein